ncbi:hypothetical protein [Mycobacterium sp. PSTR-4-N]|uniref:hypothetical protein n=1 Tax=Mycobacterium sp. PSTR-4-N TaxID=2917745 RepID=UPI001F1536F3|nr:hypothetical protein [Mycobacterium sp. PSTR-4-N]MCG7596327.1 hypothetical protein [Mycobacterium sp. PSTR-4-N]
MITTADALDVMTVVAACHRRTAPRMDDEEATLATATIWAELFNEYRLTLPDLVKGVKKRALTHADAPEPAEIIHFAREVRRDRRDRSSDRSDLEALGESKSNDAAVLAQIRRRTGVALPGKAVGNA